MQKKKKGFTLVELLVVIAILAILASVSVVGYLSFTSKAKESNDISLTTQLNTILLGESTVEGVNSTAHDAVLDLKDNGLDITKLTPTSEGYEFVYDLSQDKFFLLDKNNGVLAPSNLALSASKTDVYKFIGKDMELSNEYSNYLKDDYLATETLEISTGLDVGNKIIDSVTYLSESSDSVVLRVNSNMLTIDAVNATVNFYGKTSKANVIAVDLYHSFHVFGEILSLDVNKGHIVVENGGLVNTIKDTNINESDSNAKITIKSNGTVGAVISKNENIVESSKKPETPGIISPDNVKSGFAGGTGHEKSPYLISNKSEFTNISTLENEMLQGNHYYFKQIKDITDLDKGIRYFRGTFDGDNHDIKVKEDIAGVLDLVYYPVGDVCFKNVKLYSSSTLGASFVYEAAATQKLIFENCITDVNDKKTLNVLNQGNFGFYVRYSVLDNRDDKEIVWPDNLPNEEHKLINVPSDMVNQQSVIFKNCTNNANYQNTGTCSSIFIGQSIYPGTKLIIEDCTNNGFVIGNESAGLINGNADAYKNYQKQFDILDFEIRNLTNNGHISAKNVGIFRHDAEFDSNFTDKILGTGKIETSSNPIEQLNLKPVYSNNQFGVVDSSDKDYTYKLIFKIQTIKMGSDDSYANGRNLEISLNKVTDGKELDITKIRAYDAITAQKVGALSQEEIEQLDYSYNVEYFKVAVIIKNDNVLIIFKSTDINKLFVDSDVLTYIYGYNKEGVYVGSKIIR